MRRSTAGLVSAFCFCTLVGPVVSRARASSTDAAGPGDAASTNERAHALYLEAQFAAAAAEYERALEQPGVNRGVASESLRYLATIAGMVGDAARCATYASLARWVDADAQPGEGAPPSVRAAFESAPVLPPAALSIALESGGVRAVLTNVPDRLRAVASIELACAGAASVVSRRGQLEVRLTDVGPPPVQCHAEAHLGLDTIASSERAVAGPRGRPAADAIFEDLQPAHDDGPLLIGIGVGGGIIAIGLGIGLAVAFGGPVQGFPSSVQVLP